MIRKIKVALITLIIGFTAVNPIAYVKAGIDPGDYSSQMIQFFDKNGACSPGMSQATDSGNVKTIPVGDIPAEGMEVGATTYGGTYRKSEDKWVSTNSNQGVYIGYRSDDNGMSSYGPAMAGSTGWAELRGSGGIGKALGGLKIGTKIKISYQGKYVIAEKRDIGYGGGGSNQVDGKKKAVDLWWEVAAMLGFTGGTGVVKIHGVDPSTPLTPNNTVFDSEDRSLRNNGSALPDGNSGQSSDIKTPLASSAVCCPDNGSSTTTTGITGSTNQEKVWNFLRSRGLTPEQTAGIMGNIHQESSFSPTRQEAGKAWGSGGGWGLAQWTFGRRTKIVEKLKELHPDLVKYYDERYGGQPKDDGRIDTIPAGDNDRLIQFQLTFLETESMGRKVDPKNIPGSLRSNSNLQGKNLSEWDMLKQIKTVDEALVFWHNNFEVSADSPQKVTEARGKPAASFLSQFQGSTAGAAMSTATCAASGAASNGSLQDLVAQYAWPKYRGNDITPTAAYKAAVTKAVSEQRYVGGSGISRCGGGMPGIDCGGFVTTLMYDSGFDKGYNDNAKGGPTNQQEAWARKNWELLGRGDKINSADLKPGDVAFRPGHTYVFIGDVTTKEGEKFEYNIASSSYCQRAPMAGKEIITQSDTTWYRKKGDSSGGQSAL